MIGIRPFRPLLLAVLSLAASAQQPTPQENDRSQQRQGSENASEEAGPRDFWQVSLPGGHYMVSLKHIASISMHEYLLDGALVVNEVMVDAGGRGLARFYHITPGPGGSAPAPAARLVERGKEIVDQAVRRGGVDAHNMVHKQLPATTHTGMAEYRVLDLRDLDALYNSLQRAWESGRGQRLTIR